MSSFSSSDEAEKRFARRQITDDDVSIRVLQRVDVRGLMQIILVPVLLELLKSLSRSHYRR